MPDVERLAVLKALGDNTRYAIYLELARSASPRSTADIADTLALHPNTVRPHLERMREVGLLDVEVDGRGSVGRPQHRYLLAAAASSAGVAPDGAAAASHEAGRALARRTPGRSCVESLSRALDELGFDPAVAAKDGLATIAFTHCPYRELAEAHPEIVCNLHRGLIEGFVEQQGGADVDRFGTLIDRDPCQVELSLK